MACVLLISIIPTLNAATKGDNGKALILFDEWPIGINRKNRDDVMELVARGYI